MKHGSVEAGKMAYLINKGVKPNNNATKLFNKPAYGMSHKIKNVNK